MSIALCTAKMRVKDSWERAQTEDSSLFHSRFHIHQAAKPSIYQHYLIT